MPASVVSATSPTHENQHPTAETHPERAGRRRLPLDGCSLPLAAVRSPDVVPRSPRDMGPTSPLHVRLAYPPGRNGTPPVDASTLPDPSRDSSRRRQVERPWMSQDTYPPLGYARRAPANRLTTRGQTTGSPRVLGDHHDLFLPAAAQALRPSQYREHDPPPQEMPRTSRPDAHARLPTSDVRRGNPPTIPAHGAAFHQPPPLDRRDLEELLPVLTSPSPARSAGSRRARAHAGRILAAGLKATHSPPLVDVAKLMSPISRCQCRVATAATARDVSGLLSPARISLSLDTAPVGAGVAAVSIHRRWASTAAKLPRRRETFRSRSRSVPPNHWGVRVPARIHSVLMRPFGQSLASAATRVNPSPSSLETKPPMPLATSSKGEFHVGRVQSS
ncbi:hypothetical protein B2J93_1497 [Marssonina coronariae]|uniref:Uncharacterized protein n=1 Tax=Diplocarpon coronariae TaxID=2795749 RepID=A0A218Z449_9HELO|nr:hypothetical protein B2J93_1497 [Marssonina coronariae]